MHKSGPTFWKQAIATVGGTIGSKVCLGTAMAAVGLSTSFAVLRGVGWRPFALGLTGSLLVGTAGFGVATALPQLL